MTTASQQAKPAAPHSDPKHDDDKAVAERKGKPRIEEGTETDTPYPDDHYDTPNEYAQETVADEQRKRSDAMMHAAPEPKPGRHDERDERREDRAAKK